MKQTNRITHTIKALQSSLISLMKQKPLEKISVTEICERADVNRSTFYVYFGSPRELLDSVQNELYDEIRATKEEFSNTAELMDKMCETIDRYRELLLLTIPTHDDMGLFRVFDIYRDDVVNMLMREAGICEEKARRAYLFIAVGAAAIMTSWLIDHPRESSKGVLDDLVTLTNRGLSGYMQ